MLTNIRKITVVTKVPYLDVLKPIEQDKQREAAARGDALATSAVKACEQHHASRIQLLALLTELGCEVTEIIRPNLTKIPASTDLVISLGGDGTFLTTSRAIFNRNLPVLAVNSAPDFSVGHFCFTTAATLKETLEGIDTGKNKPIEIVRLKLTHNGDVIAVPVINEVIFGNEVDSMIRYRLTLPSGVTEQQRGTAICVSTACGSTGTHRSFGGLVIPACSPNFQFLLLGPYQRPGTPYKILGSALASGETLNLSWDTVSFTSEPSGYIRIDSARRFPLQNGDKIQIEADPEWRLSIFLNPDCHDQYVPEMSPERQAQYAHYKSLWKAAQATSV